MMSPEQARTLCVAAASTLDSALHALDELRRSACLGCDVHEAAAVLIRRHFVAQERLTWADHLRLRSWKNRRLEPLISLDQEWRLAISALNASRLSADLVPAVGWNAVRDGADDAQIFRLDEIGLDLETQRREARRLWVPEGSRSAEMDPQLLAMQRGLKRGLERFDELLRTEGECREK